MGHLITASLLIPLPGEKLLFRKLKSILIKEKNMKDNQHEQLFTELIPEEAAAINGGWNPFKKLKKIATGVVEIATDVVETATDVVETATDVVEVVAGAGVAVVGGTVGAVVGGVGDLAGYDTDIWEGIKYGGKLGYKVGREVGPVALYAAL
ncbi:hypothetical protein LC608_31865 [Nostoc sp. XA010]|uniref:hypothetical protein n=1 Tax=Nostoc sp. XA010 TaxID=2780407 RepID=UPI001E46205B|nr:hypothetical protein [Nostoc sp. XA010]MCC5661470.1 hypothetical protein [Nostoc sp. XA010]